MRVAGNGADVKDGEHEVECHTAKYWDLKSAVEDKSIVDGAFPG